MNLTPENTMERILNGEDVTPSCRAEYFVKQAIDNAGSGGGGDTYETVAEIAVGGMKKDDDLYIYISETPIEIDVTDSDSAFLNSPDMPLQWIPAKEGEEGVVMLGYNWGADGPIGSPAYCFEFGPEGVAITSDSFDLENTTVRILKKVGGETITVDSALSDTSKNPVQNKVITAALNERPVDFIITADFNPETEEITNASASLADVLAVAGAGRNIVFILHAAAESGGTTVDVYDRFSDSNIKNHGGGNGVVSFSKVEKDSGTPIIFSIIAASGDHDGKWVYDEVPLATATP